MADVPGGASGLLCREYRGKDAATPVVKVDPGVISLTFALLSHERQAAEELSQWKAPVQETKITMDATPEAIGLAMVMSKEELLALRAKLRTPARRPHAGQSGYRLSNGIM
jgi:hypothetical protein